MSEGTRVLSVESAEPAVSAEPAEPAEPATAGGEHGVISRAADWISGPAGLSALVAAIAAVVLWLTIQPLARATADTDAAASVMYFERIVNGHRLEAFFPTTPKPLLTFLYGLAWSLTHDWHSLTVMTLVAGSLGVGLAARLAARLGGIPAAAFVAVGLVAWPGFRLEVADANSFVWGLALWMLAAVLITADRPRPWLAGAALVFAGLARTETIWLIAAAAGCAAVVAFQAWRAGDLPGRTDYRSGLRLTLPPILGALAVPLACLHDFLLTGKPLYWLSVPSGYTTLTYPDLAPASPLAIIHREVIHYFPLLALLLLAAIGLARLVSTGRVGVSFSMVVFVGGVLGTLIVLGWRGVFISERYYEESDATILLAAAVGAGLMLGAAMDRAASRFGGGSAPPARARAASPRLRQAAAGGIAALLALGVGLAFIPQGGVETQLARAGKEDVAVQAAEPQVNAIVVGAAGDTITVKGVAYPVADLLGCRIFVPRWAVPEISVESGAPTTVLGDSTLAFRNGDYSDLSAGRWVLHVAAADGRGGVWAPFEHSTTTTLALKSGVVLTVVPVIANDQTGVWLLRIDATG